MFRHLACDVINPHKSPLEQQCVFQTHEDKKLRNPDHNFAVIEKNLL